MSDDHYFTAMPGGLDQRRRIQVSLPGLGSGLGSGIGSGIGPGVDAGPHAASRVEVETASGVFSADRLDPGTGVLLDHVPDPPLSGDLLDLGCGWGPIALSMAALAPQARVWAVDVNERARDLTSTNARRLGLTGVRAVAPDQVPPDVIFAAIWSNPPIRVGKPALHALLEQWLPRLAPSGDAHLVVARNLGADSLARWLTGEGWPTTRAASERGYRLLRVARTGSTGVA